MKIMMPLMDVFVDYGGLQSDTLHQTPEEILDVIRGLKKGDVIALRYLQKDHLVIVENNRSENVPTLEGVQGWSEGWSQWFYHKPITDLALIAPVDSFGARFLGRWAEEKHNSEERLRRIEERVREEKKKLDKLAE